MTVTPAVIKISCPWVSSPASTAGVLVSYQLGLIFTVKQINDDVGEPRTEAKLVLGHLGTTQPLYSLPPSVYIL